MSCLGSRSSDGTYTITGARAYDTIKVCMHRFKDTILLSNFESEDYVMVCAPIKPYPRLELLGQLGLIDSG